MNPEPLTPLVKRDEDPFERALLRAGQRERAPRGADRRLLATLGVGGGSALSALLATYASKIGAKGLLASIAVSVVAIAAGSFVVSSSHDATEPPATVPVAAPPSAPSPAPSSTDVRVEALPSTRVEDLPSSPPTAAKPAGKPAPATTASTARAEGSETGGGLAREVELVQAARAALARGDTGDALERLDVHDREFPRGTLQPESRVLRIEALVRAGGAHDLARANALGDTFLSEHPSGPHARRVRAVLGRQQ